LRRGMLENPASPRAVSPVRDHPGELVSDEPPPVAVLRADREVIERAAAALRGEAIRQGYAGLQHPAAAFGFALLLDELARHLRELDDELRQRVVAEQP
jgi:hypothetical protein